MSVLVGAAVALITVLARTAPTTNEHDVESVELRGVPTRGWSPPTAEILYYRLDVDRPQRIVTRRIAPDGTLPIRWVARGETRDIDRFVEVRVRHADGAVAMVDEGSGLSRVPLRRLRAATLQPVVPLVRVFQVDADGAPIRSASAGLLQYGTRDRRRTDFLMTEPRFATAGWLRTCREFRALRFRAGRFPIDEDGSVRVRPHEVFDAGGVVHVRSDHELPYDAALTVDVATRGRFEPTHDTAVSIERVDEKHLRVSGLSPGTYRLTIGLRGGAKGGSVALGDVDVDPGGVSEVRISDPLTVHRFALDLELPEDPRRRRRHWKVRLDAHDDHGWMSFARRRNDVRWLGDRPTSAQLGLQLGPRAPDAFPLRWTSEDLAEVDASDLLMHRALVDTADLPKGHLGFYGGTPTRTLDVGLSSTVALGPGGEDRLEVTWCGDARPSMPVIVMPKDDPTLSLYADDDVVASSRLVAWLEPGDAAVSSVLTPSALRPVDVRLKSVQPRTIRVFAWFGRDEIPPAVLQAPRLEMLRAISLLDVTSLSLPEDESFVFPSERCTLLIHDVDRAASAVIDHGELRSGTPLALDLDALVWSEIPAASR